MKKKFKGRLTAIPALIFIFTSIHITQAYAKKTEEGYFLSNIPKETFELIKSRPELTIDHLILDQSSGVSFELYGPNGLGKFLENTGVEFTPLSGISKKILNTYPTPEEIGNELQQLAQRYSTIAKVFSIGKSVSNRDLWMANLTGPNSTQNPTHTRPKFLLIGNMHGDEITGREMLMQFIKELLTMYEKDPKITTLVNQLDIYIMPSLNPDGAARARRGNARNIDLNRDFPDFTTNDNQNTIPGREPETMALMSWQKNKKFILSANFHGGAEVVNYPWDTTSAHHPEVDLIKEISLNYAKEAPYIGNSTTFENGIVNGYAWYEINGGLQDWNNYYENNLHITIELSDEKWPAYSKMPYYYQENRLALIYLLEKAAGGLLHRPMTIERIMLEQQKELESLKQ